MIVQDVAFVALLVGSCIVVGGARRRLGRLFEDAKSVGRICSCLIVINDERLLDFSLHFFSSDSGRLVL